MRPNSPQTDQRCPYSDPPYSEFTEDHIFPQFLGGRRTIRVCRDCNSRFGHSFEAEAAKQLKRLQVLVSHLGFDLTGNPAAWPAAITIEDRTYDLLSGPRIEYRLAHPVITRKEEGKIVGAQLRSKSEAQRFAKNLLDSGKARRVEIEEREGEVFDEMRVDLAFSFNPSLYRFATKLAAALAVHLGYKSLIVNSGIPQYLHGQAGWLTSIAYCDTTLIRQLRPALNHTIYVEFGTTSYAVVMIFGTQQICPASFSRPESIYGHARLDHRR